MNYTPVHLACKCTMCQVLDIGKTEFITGKIKHGEEMEIEKKCLVKLYQESDRKHILWERVCNLVSIPFGFV